MLYFIGVAFLQSLKWAILFIYTRDGSTFTFKLKPHYVCFNLRPEGGGEHCHIWARYVFAVRSGRVFLSSSVWRVDSGTPHPKFRICSPFVLVLRRKSFCINIAFLRYKVLAKKVGWMSVTWDVLWIPSEVGWCHDLSVWNKRQKSNLLS